MRKKHMRTIIKEDDKDKLKRADISLFLMLGVSLTEKIQ
jgi:hypothetical protein